MSRWNRLVRAGEWAVLLPVWRRFIKSQGWRVAAASGTGLFWFIIIIVIATSSGGDDGKPAPGSASTSPKASATSSPPAKSTASVAATATVAATTAAPTENPTEPPTVAQTAPPTEPPRQAPTQPPAAGVTITSISSPVSRNSNATVQAQTVAGASCTITYDTPAGNPSGASGLEAKTADSGGSVSWTWKIGGSTTLGTGSVTVRCAGASARADIVIQ
jgi:hypothetical protein